MAMLQGAPPLLIALAVSLCMALAVWYLARVERRTRRIRLHSRRAVGRPILITWNDDTGDRRSEEGFCQNVSTGGIGLALPCPLKPHTRLEFQLSEPRLSGTGLVCRCTRVAERYLVGVRFDPWMRAAMSLQLQEAGGESGHSQPESEQSPRPLPEDLPQECPGRGSNGIGDPR
jgi:hypothetical protein